MRHQEERRFHIRQGKSGIRAASFLALGTVMHIHEDLMRFIMITTEGIPVSGKNSVAVEGRFDRVLSVHALRQRERS